MWGGNDGDEYSQGEAGETINEDELEVRLNPLSNSVNLNIFRITTNMGNKTLEKHFLIV